jgi:hypothetical protein
MPIACMIPASPRHGRRSTAQACYPARPGSRCRHGQVVRLRRRDSSAAGGRWSTAALAPRFRIACQHSWHSAPQLSRPHNPKSAKQREANCPDAQVDSGPARLAEQIECALLHAGITDAYMGRLSLLTDGWPAKRSGSGCLFLHHIEIRRTATTGANVPMPTRCLLSRSSNLDNLNFVTGFKCNIYPTLDFIALNFSN